MSSENSAKNLNEHDNQKQTSKHVTMSEKILNGPIMSDENNESNRPRTDDKVTSNNFRFTYQNPIKRNAIKQMQTKIKTTLRFCDDVAKPWR